MRLASVRVSMAAIFLSLSAHAQVLTRASVRAAPSPVLSVPSSLMPSGLLPVALSVSAPSLAVTVAPVLSVPHALRPVRAVAAVPERPNPLRQLRQVVTDWLKPGVVADEDGPAAVAAYVLDLDGNAFGPGFPTKIILFKKGGNQELPVSTAHFAVIEKNIGTDFAYGGANLKDYELRGDASFRNFFGPAFTADLKYAVENLPDTQWQGPSWPALVHALSDPRLASQVYVLTARQHTSEQLLDGFRYLQSVGYIRHLPKVENLHGVGGSAHTATRKAELMVDIIDGLQSAPSGEAGRRHTVGFSDDTWENYELMRDALSAIILREPARWTRVKILLFFTGSNDVSHAPETVVLN